MSSSFKLCTHRLIPLVKFSYIFSTKYWLDITYTFLRNLSTHIVFLFLILLVRIRNVGLKGVKLSWNRSKMHKISPKRSKMYLIFWAVSNTHSLDPCLWHQFHQCTLIDYAIHPTSDQSLMLFLQSYAYLPDRNTRFPKILFDRYFGLTQSFFSSGRASGSKFPDEVG